jgi:hypothetical protein
LYVFFLASFLGSLLVRSAGGLAFQLPPSLLGFGLAHLVGLVWFLDWHLLALLLVISLDIGSSWFLSLFDLIL